MASLLTSQVFEQVIVIVDVVVNVQQIRVVEQLRLQLVHRRIFSGFAYKSSFNKLRAITYKAPHFKWPYRQSLAARIDGCVAL